MILTTTTQKLQVFFAGARATNDCPIVIDYVDFTTTTTTPGLTPTNSNGVTTTDILAAPAASTQRKVNSVSLFNADTASVVVTIQINDNSTLYPVVSAMTVAAGAVLEYTDRIGWRVVTGSGGAKQRIAAQVQEFQANGTWTNPGSWRYVMVECVGGGGGGQGGASNGCAPNVGGGGGGGGKRTRYLFAGATLPSTVSVTVGAAGAAGATGAGLPAPPTAGTGGTSSFGTFLYAYGGAGGSGSGLGGGGGGGTSAGSGATGGSAFQSPTSAVQADDRGANGGNGGFGSFLGGGAGGNYSAAGSTYNGGYSWFSAGGGAGGGTSSTRIGNGGGAGASVTTDSVGRYADSSASVGARTDVLGCGTGGAAGFSGGFPGGGGGASQAPTDSVGFAGGAGVVRVWCW